MKELRNLALIPNLMQDERRKLGFVVGLEKINVGFIEIRER